MRYGLPGTGDVTNALGPEWLSRYRLGTASASPNEVILVAATLAECLTSRWPERLIGDGAYESDALDAGLARLGVVMIAPHRRYRRCWKIERLFAWMQNLRRLVVCYQVRFDNFLGIAHLACALTVLRHL